MVLSMTVNDVEDQRLLAQLLREQEIDAAISLAPVNVRTGRDHSPGDDAGGVTFQQCGGGRRVIRNKIGGS